MMRRTMAAATGLAACFGLALGIVIGTGLMSCRTPLSALDLGKGIPQETKGDFRLIAEAWDMVERHYVDRSALQPTKLTYGAISGIMEALGDTGHSAFLTPEMVAQARRFERNKFTGIGAEIQMKQGNVVIVAPMDGSPAQRAGIRPGDAILKVNGENISSLPLHQAVERITGPPGTSVTLTIMTSGTGRIEDLTLVRQDISVQNVTWQRLPDSTIAHVRIAHFNRHATRDLKAVLGEVTARHFTGVVLDLRNNPGGLLEEAIGVTSQFIESGDVLREKNSQGQITPVPARGGGTLLHLPLIALVNGGTASAAEITAGALKDTHRAVLVGETTFGTGTVLKQFGLSDGSALMIATEEWLTPKGQTIWHRGITPDVAVTLSPEAVPAFPPTGRGMGPADLRLTGDAQLLRALELLGQRRGLRD